MTLLDVNQSLRCRILDLRGEWSVLQGFQPVEVVGGRLSGVTECIDLEFPACDRQYFCAQDNLLAKTC